MSMPVPPPPQRSPTFHTDDHSVITQSPGSPTSSSGNTDGDGNSQQPNETRKRKRPSKTSCELCKARKVKCDRASPACGWCARNNRFCEYRERGKTGPRPQSRELEAKVNRIEAMLQVLGRRVEDHILEHQASSQGLRPSQPIPLPEYGPYPSGSPANLDMASENMSVTLPMPSYSGTYGPRRASFSGDGGMASQTSTGGPSPAQSLQPVQSGVSSVNYDPPQLYFVELPPYDLLFSLVDLYFKHVNPWSPILDRKATFDTLSSYSNLSMPDRILFAAILCTTLRFCRDPRVSQSFKEHFVEASKRKIHLYGLEYPSVRALQALVILAVDVLGSSNEHLGLNLLSIITSNVVRLGLGIERRNFLASSAQSFSPVALDQSLSQPTCWIEDEERRRLFWMLYILDRYATVATTFDFTLNEMETDRPLPCRYDLFSKNQSVDTRWFRSPESTETIVNKPENLGSFSYHCEVLRILSRIHRFLRKPIDIGSLAEIHRWRESYRKLDADLTSWLHNLPDEYGKISQLCHSDPGSRISNWIMLHAAFVTSVIRLHSSAAYPTSRSYIFTPSHNAIQRCLSAVESLRAIAQDVVNGGMLDLLGPPFAFSLWVCARLLLVDAATMERDVDPKIFFFITTLDKMGTYWQVAQDYADTLRRVVQRPHPELPSSVSPSQRFRQPTPSGRDDHHHRQQPPNTDPNLPTTTSKFTLMRRRAHDLSLLSTATTHPPSQTDLDSLSIFNFFNYPRLAGPSSMLRDKTVNAAGVGEPDSSATRVKFPTPNPNVELDWLASDENEENGESGNNSNSNNGAGGGGDEVRSRSRGGMGVFNPPLE